MLCLSKQPVHHSLPPSEQPWPQPNWSQNLGHNSATNLPDKSAGSEWFDAASDWWMGWSETEHYWQYHWPVAQASPCLHSSHMTFWIFTVTQIRVQCRLFAHPCSAYYIGLFIMVLWLRYFLICVVYFTFNYSCTLYCIPNMLNRQHHCYALC